MSKARAGNTTEGNQFYRKHFHKTIVALIVTIFLMIGCVVFLLYQVHHRPIPLFNAAAPDGRRMMLPASEDPNLLPDTLIKWANQAAVASYTYDFSNYETQLALARPYFTNTGWTLYRNSIQNLLNSIAKNKLSVTSVVTAPSVISNSGQYPGLGMAWRIQIPFLVGYEGAENVTMQRFTVTLTIVRVPTTQNPAGIGIDQFVMR